MRANPIYGGVEAGGTKFNCMIAGGPDEILAEARFPTTTPAETLGKVIRFFEEHGGGNLSAIGVAAFGPLDLNPSSPTFGQITATPKPGWANSEMVSPLREAFGVPVAFDTDVNGAALGEHLWGAAQGLDTFIYLTVGTGIGGGVMAGGQLVHGLIHPEVGHIRIPHDWERDPFPGSCPFHGDCLEGLAAGPAVKARWGQPAEDLPPGHPAWDLEAEYLALALHNYILSYSPQRIILGGGLLHQPELIAKVRERVKISLNGYVQHPAVSEAIEDFIVLPGLGDRSGTLGAVGLARQMLSGK